MADYWSPTVVRPNLSLIEMTPIEALLLTAMFDAEQDDDALYFFAEDCFNDMPALEVDEARAALAENSEGCTADIVRAMLERLEPGADVLQFEDEAPWEQALQDIVRRSSTLDHIEVITSFTCSKMRPDGFGGAVTIITAEQMLSSSTDDMARELLDRAEFGELACAPGFGSHIVLRLDEADVRATLGEIFETEAADGITINDVTADDVRAACITAIEQRDLSHEHGELAFAAALQALRIATGRHLSTR